MFLVHFWTSLFSRKTTTNSRLHKGKETRNCFHTSSAILCICGDEGVVDVYKRVDAYIYVLIYSMKLPFALSKTHSFGKCKAI